MIGDVRRDAGLQAARAAWNGMQRSEKPSHFSAGVQGARASSLPDIDVCIDVGCACTTMPTCSKHAGRAQASIVDLNTAFSSLECARALAAAAICVLSAFSRAERCKLRAAVKPSSHVRTFRSACCACPGSHQVRHLTCRMLASAAAECACGTALNAVPCLSQGHVRSRDIRPVAAVRPRGHTARPLSIACLSGCRRPAPIVGGAPRCIAGGTAITSRAYMRPRTSNSRSRMARGSEDAVYIPDEEEGARRPDGMAAMGPFP